LGLLVKQLKRIRWMPRQSERMKGREGPAIRFGSWQTKLLNPDILNGKPPSFRLGILH